MILALDIGTSSTRAIVYDPATCQAVADGAHSIHHDPHTTPDGGATLDPDALVREVVAAIAAVLPAAKGAAIAGVGVSTFWHSVVGVDASGAAQTPVLLWSDRRSAPQVAALRGELDAGAYSQRTGCPLHTSYLPGRLRWLRETDPETFARCARFVSPGEYLVAHLFGLDKATCSVSMASATGLLDQRRGAWDEATLAHLPGITAAHLSPLSDAPVSGLLPDYGATLALLADTPWFPALGDGACSNLGCGALDSTTLALMIGTSGALRVSGRRKGDLPPLPPGLWRYLVSPDHYLMGGALSNGGNVWSWLTHTLRLPTGDDAAVETALGLLAPDAHGLTVLPFLSGERAPLWRDDLSATLHGLEAGTTPLEIARAFLEAVAYRFADVREALHTVCPPGARIIGTGAGLLHAPVWAQIIADVLGEAISLSSEEQASSRGAALWVRERLGLGRITDAPAVALTQTITPDPANADVYGKARARQADLLGRLWG